MKGTCGWLIAGLALLAGWAGPAAAEDNQLNIYNWADYIGKNTVAEFEKATGIKVVYDTYDSDEALEAKIMAGNSGYDIVSTSASFFGRQIQAGVYEPVDKSKLPNWKNLDPRIVKVVAGFDAGNAHAVPYMHGVNGFAYNVDLIKQRMPDAPLDSLDMIFKPEIVAKFADCGVTFLDSPQDVLPLALNYLHKDPNSSDPEDYKAAEKLLLASLHPHLRQLGISQQPAQQGGLHRDVVVGRLRHGRGAGRRRRGEGQPRLHRSQGRRRRMVRRAARPEGRAAFRERHEVPRFHDGSQGDRRGHQRHPLRQ